MAKKQRPPTDREKEYAKRIITRLFVVTIILTIISTALVFIGFTYLVVMIIISLLPAIVASIVDRRPRKFASKTVTCFNIAGLLPPLFDTFLASDPDIAAQHQLADPYTWIMVYGFAGFGWLVVFVIPQMVFLFLVVRSDHTIKKLEAKRNELVEEWGERVRGSSQ
jgi:hypothetical protein